MQLKIPLADRFRYAFEAFSRTHKPDDAARDKLNAMPEAEFEHALWEVPDTVGDAARRVLAKTNPDVEDVIAVVQGLYGAPWDAQRTIMAYLANENGRVMFLPVVQKWCRDNASRMTAPFK